ncbi:hypothetical protein [Herbaspirillum sp. NPDC101396]|uniref:hypothetical protein n=1 Tax=Herbaspirillum sp. NPDC101396 TaxID=3364005 RepID=UPI00383A0BBA
MSDSKPDTNSQEWQMICLARHVCRLPSKADRIAFVDLLRQKRIGRDRKEDPVAIAAADAFAESLKALVQQEWALMYPKK